MNFSHPALMMLNHRALNISDYNKLNLPDQDSCPEQLLCTEDDVLEMLLSLDTTKSRGPDGISATMLKQTAVSIALGITKLMNTSIRSGKLPRYPRLSQFLKGVTTQVSTTTGRFLCFQS